MHEFHKIFISLFSLDAGWHCANSQTLWVCGNSVICHGIKPLAKSCTYYNPCNINFVVLLLQFTWTTDWKLKIVLLRHSRQQLILHLSKRFDTGSLSWKVMWLTHLQIINVLLLQHHYCNRFSVFVWKASVDQCVWQCCTLIDARDLLSSWTLPQNSCKSWIRKLNDSLQLNKR